MPSAADPVSVQIAHCGARSCPAASVEVSQWVSFIYKLNIKPRERVPQMSQPRTCAQEQGGAAVRRRSPGRLASMSCLLLQQLRGSSPLGLRRLIPASQPDGAA